MEISRHSQQGDVSARSLWGPEHNANYHKLRSLCGPGHNANYPSTSVLCVPPATHMSLIPAGTWKTIR
ncbi:hypothetical protein C0Q70_02952 [Pomacea canaliculata]|uniref:Uncharacterized protein n=1 Tax=Pomacea canaliculata TaxID=400727 RepID=A0A2T7PRC9_POMCA|nr:hypothetical protein C0Q70_02952 [Pomacea canaliculata]